MTNDELLQKIENLERQVRMLQISPLSTQGDRSIITGDVTFQGQTALRLPIIYALSSGAIPTDADANGVFLNAFGETFDGSTLYQLGGVNNGGLMFGLRSTDGAALFMGGQGIIDNTGINTTGINYGMRQYAEDPTDSTTKRYFRLEMLLPDGKTQPAGALTFMSGDVVNLITNGDAEAGDLSNWTQSGTLWSADSAEYHGGAYSFKFDNNLSTAETLTSDRYAASASKIYSISSWMKDYNELVSISIPVDKCTYMNSFVPTTNLYGSNAASGWISSSSQKYHGLIKFDYSSIPNNIYSIYSSSINLHNYTLDSHVQNIYRCLRAWVETEATWNIYSTGNSWGTAGAENATDREASVIGTKTVTTEEYQSISLDTSKTKDMAVGSFTNNGFVCRGVTESGATNKAVEYQDYSDALRAYHSIAYIEASKYTVYMKWYDDASAGSLIRTDTLFTENNTNSWNERTATVTAPAGALSYEIVISGDKGREFWVDDIVVAEQTFANKLLFLPELSYQDSDSTRRILSAKKELYAPQAPVIALVATASGNCTNGAHLCKITFVDSDGETEASAASNSVTVDASHKQITCPLEVGPWGTTARNIYMTEAGGTTYKLAGTQADNTTTSYTINVSDANLTTVAPVVNLSGSRPLFPRGGIRFWNEFISNLTMAAGGNSPTHAFSYNTTLAASCNDGDWFTSFMYLEDGTYTFNWYGVTTAQSGRIDFYLDNVVVTTWDTYSAVDTYNITKSSTGITVSGSGYHKIKMIVNGKNGSATDYRNVFSYIEATKAAETDF